MALIDGSTNVCFAFVVCEFDEGKNEEVSDEDDEDGLNDEAES